MKQAILQKMLKNASTLQIREVCYKRPKSDKKECLFKNWIQYTKGASILDVQQTLYKTQMPFNFREAFAFLQGWTNEIVIDNGDKVFKVGI